MKFHASSEAIEAQGKSDLNQGLIDIFKESRRKYEEYAKKKKDPLASLLNYFKKNLTPKFKELVKKETGIIIDKIHYYETPILNAAIMPRLYNDASTLDAMWRYQGEGGMDSGTKGFYFPKDKMLTWEEFKDISDSLDRKTGKVDPKRVKKYNLHVELLLDLATMVAVKEEVHPEAQNLTPEEAAAVWLHEIGHQISLIDHAADGFQTFNTKLSVLKQFMENSSLTEKIKALKYYLEKAEEYKGQSSGLDTIIDASSYIVNNFSSLASAQDKNEIMEYAKQKGQSNESFTKKAVAEAASLMVLLLNFLVVNIFLALLTIEGILVNIFGVFGIPSLGWRAKYSDISNTPKIGINVERYADEYASMHGGGAEIASGLSKIHEAAGLSYLPLPPNYQSAFNSKFYTEAVHLLSMVLLTSIREDERFDNYENMHNRIKSFQQDAINVLKDETISDTMKAHYIQEYNQIDKLIEQRRKKRSKIAVRFVNGMFTIIETLLDGYSILDIVMDAKFRKKYSEIAATVKNIEASPLFHKAVQLEIYEKEK